MMVQFAEGLLLKGGGGGNYCMFTTVSWCSRPIQFLKLIVILRSSVTTKAYLKCKHTSSN